MGRKPAPGLPDVFAKPGGAPSRGISLEDLPKSASEPDANDTPVAIDTPAAHLVAEPIAAAFPASTVTRSPASSPSHSPDDPAPSPIAPAERTPIIETPPVIDPITTADPTAGADPTTAIDPTTPAVPTTPTAPTTPTDPTTTADASATAEAPSTANPTARRGGIGGVPALVWVVLVASLTAPLWEDAALSGLGIHTPTERSAARTTTALEQQDASLATLEQRLTSTTTQIEALRANLALATQRAADAATQARAVALLRLADALHGSAPFATELAVLHATGSDTGRLQAALTQLAPYASTGAPSLDQLLRDLRVLHDSVARAVRQANPASWLDTLSRLSGAQTSSQIDPNLRAARAGLTRLAAGDVTGAIEQVNQVDGAYQTDFSDWVAEAKARLAADTALREIDTLIARPASTQ